MGANLLAMFSKYHYMEGLFIRDGAFITCIVVLNIWSLYPLLTCLPIFSLQEVLEDFGVDVFLMGMASQLAEREDRVLVHDLRGACFFAFFCAHKLTKAMQFKSPGLEQLHFLTSLTITITYYPVSANTNTE